TEIRRRRAHGFFESRRLEFIAARRARQSEARIPMPRHVSRRLSPGARTRSERSAAQIAGFQCGRDDGRDDGVRSLLRLGGILQSDRARNVARVGPAQSRQYRCDRRGLRRAGESRMRVSDRRRTSPSRFDHQGGPPGGLPCDGVPVTLHEIKLYFAYTSPYSYLAMQPAYDLELSHSVRVRFMPYGVNIRKVYGPLDRADADRRKVRYLYIDARRIAKERGLVIYPPKK